MFSVSNCMHEEFRSCTKNHRRLGLDTSGWTVAVSHLSFVFCPWNHPPKLPSIFGGWWMLVKYHSTHPWYSMFRSKPQWCRWDPWSSGTSKGRVRSEVQIVNETRSKGGKQKSWKLHLFFCKFRGVRHQNRYWIYLNIRSYKTKRDLRSCQFLLSCQLFPRVQTLMLLWVFLYIAIVLAMNATRRLIVNFLVGNLHSTSTSQNDRALAWPVDESRVMMDSLGTRKLEIRQRSCILLCLLLFYYWVCKYCTQSCSAYFIGKHANHKHLHLNIFEPWAIYTYWLLYIYTLIQGSYLHIHVT